MKSTCLQVGEDIHRAYLSEKIYAPLILKQKGFSSEDPFIVQMPWSQPIKASAIRDLKTGKAAEMSDADKSLLDKRPGIFVHYNSYKRIEYVDMAADGLYRIRRYVKELLKHERPLFSDRYSTSDESKRVVGPLFRISSGQEHTKDYIDVSEAEIQRLSFRELLYGFWVFSPTRTMVTPRGYIDGKHIASTLEDALSYLLSPLVDKVKETAGRNVEDGVLVIKHINAFWDR